VVKELMKVIKREISRTVTQDVTALPPYKISCPKIYKRKGGAQGTMKDALMAYQANKLRLKLIKVWGM
jgi:hypothetical protein